MLVVGEPPLHNRARSNVHGVRLAPLLRLHLRPIQMTHHSKFHPEPVASPPLELVAVDDAVPPRPCSWSHSMRITKGCVPVAAVLDLDHGISIPSSAAAGFGHRRLAAGEMTWTSLA